MTLEAPQRHFISVGDTDYIRVRFNDRLDDSEVLNGTPTMVEVTTTDLNLSSKTVLTSAYTDSDGVSVPANTAVACLVSGGNVANSAYTIRVTVATTSTPAKTLVRDIKLSFV